jgi:hypothetical protein
MEGAAVVVQRAGDLIEAGEHAAAVGIFVERGAATRDARELLGRRAGARPSGTASSRPSSPRSSSSTSR